MRYWPEVDGPMKEINSFSGKIFVKNTQESNTSDYTLRELVISKDVSCLIKYFM